MSTVSEKAIGKKRRRRNTEKPIDPEKRIPKFLPGSYWAPARWFHKTAAEMKLTFNALNNVSIRRRTRGPRLEKPDFVPCLNLSFLTEDEKDRHHVAEVVQEEEKNLVKEDGEMIMQESVSEPTSSDDYGAFTVSMYDDSHSDVTTSEKIVVASPVPLVSEYAEEDEISTAVEEAIKERIMMELVYQEEKHAREEDIQEVLKDEEKKPSYMYTDDFETISESPVEPTYSSLSESEKVATDQKKDENREESAFDDFARKVSDLSRLTTAIPKSIQRIQDQHQRHVNQKTKRSVSSTIDCGEEQQTECLIGPVASDSCAVTVKTAPRKPTVTKVKPNSTNLECVNTEGPARIDMQPKSQTMKNKLGDTTLIGDTDAKTKYDQVVEWLSRQHQHSPLLSPRDNSQQHFPDPDGVPNSNKLTTVTNSIYTSTISAEEKVKQWTAIYEDICETMNKVEMGLHGKLMSDIMSDISSVSSPDFGDDDSCSFEEITFQEEEMQQAENFSEICPDSHLHQELTDLINNPRLASSLPSDDDSLSSLSSTVSFSTASDKFDRKVKDWTRIWDKYIKDLGTRQAKKTGKAKKEQKQRRKATSSDIHNQKINVNKENKKSNKGCNTTCGKNKSKSTKQDSSKLRQDGRLAEYKTEAEELTRRLTTIDRTISDLFDVKKVIETRISTNKNDIFWNLARLCNTVRHVCQAHKYYNDTPTLIEHKPSNIKPLEEKHHRLEPYLPSRNAELNNNNVQLDILEAQLRSKMHQNLKIIENLYQETQAICSDARSSNKSDNSSMEKTTYTELFQNFRQQERKESMHFFEKPRFRN